MAGRGPGGRAPDPRALAPTPGAPAVGALAVALAVLLAAHYLLKTVREPLVLVEAGPAGKAMATAATALVLVPVLTLYDRLARRLGPRALAVAVFGAGVAGLVGFAALAALGHAVGLALHVWLGVFAALAISQVWSAAAGLRGDRRALARVGLGGALGAIAGAAVAARVVPALPPAWSLLIGAALLALALGPLLRGCGGDAGARATPAGPTPPREAPRGGQRGYLRLVAALTVLASCVATLGEYALDRALVDAVAPLGDPAAAAAIATFKGRLYGVVNVAALGLQLALASRAFPLGATLALPALACLAGWAGAALLPTLAGIAAVKATESALGHSLHGTLRHALFAPTSRSARVRAKAWIDTVGPRLGDLLAGGLVAGGTLAGAGLPAFAGVAAALSAGWLALVGAVARGHARRSRADEVPAPARASVVVGGQHHEVPGAVALEAEQRLAVPERPVHVRDRARRLPVHLDHDVAGPEPRPLGG